MLDWIKKSIIRRVLALVFVSIILIFSVYGYILNNQIRTFFVSETKGGLLKDSKQIATEVNSFMEKNIVLVEQMTTNQDFINILKEVKDRYKKRENPNYYRVTDQLQKIKATDPSIALVYIGLGDASDLITDMPEYDAKPDYVLRERGWYADTIKAGKTIVTAPYVDAVTGKLVISIATPIMENGKDLGSFAIDVMIDDIGKIMKNYKIGDTGYATLVSSDAMIVSHPDEKLAMKAKITELEGTIGEIGKKMVAGESGIADYTFEGVPKFFGYSNVPAANWSVGTVVTQKEVTGKVDAFMTFNISIIAIAGLLTMALLYISIRRNLSPIPVILDGIDGLSNGDLTSRVDINRADEMGKIANAVNSLGESMSNMIGKLKVSSDEMDSASDMLVSVSNRTRDSLLEVAKAISEVARTSTNQASVAQDSVEEVHLFGEEIEKVVSSTNELYENTQNVGTLSRKGSDTLRGLSQKSLENQESVKNIKAIVDEVDSSTQEITSIIDIINAISEKTNLLALNASIEAARAGDAGRGFAVVADEIRKLAEQTSESTDEISKKINNIREKSKHAVSFTNTSEEIAKNNEVMVVETETIFKEIEDTIQTLFKITQETQKSSNSMNSNKNNITKQIENISSSIEDTSASMEEMSASTDEQMSTIENLALEAEKLKVVSNELHSLLKNFHV